MTDEEALRAAVLARPDDDTPRLVYADWCDDAGDADRAAFIRAQVEAARTEPYSPAARAAEARAAALREAQRDAWVMTSEFYCEAEFVRGFVEGVDLRADQIRDRLPELCAANPVRRLGLGTGIPFDSPDFERDADVLGAAALAPVRALDLSRSNLYAPTEFDCLSDSAPLQHLSDLRLSSLPVPPEWLGRFLAGGQLPELAALDVSDIPNLAAALANGLRDAPHRRFTTLNLSGVRLLSGELKRVLASPAVHEIEDFDLGWTFPGPGPLTMLDLGWVLPWARLTRLDVRGQQLGSDGVKELVRKPEARRLRWLGLGRNGIGTEGARLLAAAPHLNLYHLDVSDNGLSPADLAALRGRFPEAVVVG